MADDDLQTRIARVIYDSIFWVGPTSPPRSWWDPLKFDDLDTDGVHYAATMTQAHAVMTNFTILDSADDNGGEAA